MTVEEAILAAEGVLPGRVAQDGEPDPRWHAVIAVAEFIETEPEAVWSFTKRCGCSSDEALRAASSTCMLEHLLEHHFDAFIGRVEEAAMADRFFGEMVTMCWKFGQSEKAPCAARLDRLIASVRDRTR